MVLKHERKLKPKKIIQMEIAGNLLKMQTELGETVDYYLRIGNEKVYMNQYIGKKIGLKYLHKINCIRCGRETNKSFFQGYCYPCFISAPETDACILHPEKCMAHEGISRDMEWSKANCLTDHYVYLAVSSGLKVGVTRKSQIPTRWIDQGAHRAVRLAMTPNRYLAGLIEVDLKQYLADKTSWQQMLKNMVKQPVDLQSERKKAAELLRDDLKQYLVDNDDIIEISYPVEKYPSKVKSISFDKTDEYSGVLRGIKGQYFIFEDGMVFNVRKHNGYLAQLVVNA
ncbi:MAG: DUF2797 domain-containing protein [Bacteroidales bacterium]